jgi:uncharacterized membrane protein
MKLENHRFFFIIMGIIGLLLIASPALLELIPIPAGEQFSELYMLDSNHLTNNYPHNVTLGQDYSIYVGVGNRLHAPAYYVLHVKLLSDSDQLPNAQMGESSSAKIIYEYNFAVDNNQTWESVLNFSITQGSTTTSQALINNISINGNDISVNKSALWDSNSLNYPYKLLLELWVYNAQQDKIDYSNRYVYLNFNFSTPA